MKRLGVFCALACALFAVAARAAPPLEAYGKLPAMEFVSLSPGGDRIAFVATDGEKRRLFVRKIGGEAIMAADVGTSKIRDLHWAGEKYLVLLASATVKYGTGALDKWSRRTRAELWAMLVVNTDDHSARKVFEGHETDVWLGAIEGVYGSWSHDGNWYEFVRAYSLQGRRYHAYKVDLATGKYTDLTPGVIDDTDFLVTGDGAVGLHSYYNELTKTWGAFLGASGKQPIVTKHMVLIDSQIDGLGRSRDTMLVTGEGNGHYTYDEYPIALNATPTPIFAGEEIGRFVRDPATDVLLGGIRPDGQTAIFFDPKLQAHFDAVKKAFKGYAIRLETWSSNLQQMVVMTSGGDDPGTYWLVNMATGKADELMSAYPAIAPKDVGPTRMFAYKAGDGLPLEGVLTLPPGREAKDLPLVVLPHGGPLGQSDHVGFDWWAQAFASRGYAVLQPNFRGSSGYGYSFKEKGYGEWGRKMLSDMTDGVQALAAAGIADKDRVCIVGGSYGGYAAMAGATFLKAGFRCAVAVSGISEVGEIMAHDGGDSSDSPWGRLNHRLFGVDSAASSALAEVSPLRHAAEATAPILLIHGKDDTVVPFIQSLSLHENLDRAGKTNAFVILSAEDHWLSHEATRTETLKASVGWVMENNPPN